jgi:3-dehydroquinate dehydratase-2
MKVLVINGPNLSRLDIRDSSIYGEMTYPQLEAHIRSAAESNGFVGSGFQYSSDY